ncbi:MAG: aldehyde dehydrogenase family protein, partial [Thermoanaerobaculia bacterium]|nr:aldehyde dehydrogenase family protein [Thermoanaerobaculia bacterium]
MTVQPITPADPERSPERSLREILDRQRASFLATGPPSAEIRLDRLDRAIGTVVDHEQEIVAALAHDFGHRSHDQSLLTDVAGSIEPLRFAKKHLRRWMRPERRRPQFPLGLLGARAEVRYQPLGVVGIISPWNFPVNLTFAPLAGVLAAGNRAMIKPSEHTPATSALIARMVETVFDETEVAVVTGGPEVGAAFSELPFDHLVFTGATAVARHVMRAASQNLVPVTLELGGKSPVIIGASADLEAAALRVMAGKMMNAGQICLAPDYVLLPAGKERDFVAAATAAVAEMFDGLRDNPDYTAVVNDRHAERLASWLEDARAAGAETVEINPRGESFDDPEVRKVPPTLVLDAPDDCRVMTEEIFGPILPIRSYASIDEAIGYVNERPRPLGLYY